MTFNRHAMYIPQIAQDLFALWQSLPVPLTSFTTFTGHLPLPWVVIHCASCGIGTAYNSGTPVINVSESLIFSCTSLFTLSFFIVSCVGSSLFLIGSVELIFSFLCSVFVDFVFVLSYNQLLPVSLNSLVLNAASVFSNVYLLIFDLFITSWYLQPFIHSLLEFTVPNFQCK
jgi:hypothetical protein